MNQITEPVCPRCPECNSEYQFTAQRITQILSGGWLVQEVYSCTPVRCMNYLQMIVEIDDEQYAELVGIP